MPKAKCSHCGSTFHGLDRNEDGSPDIPATKCADETCEVYLCEAGCQDLSFQCDGCDRRFCNEHVFAVEGDLKLCVECFEAVEEAA